MAFDVANAIYLVNSSYEIAMGNYSGENKMFFDLGAFGLLLDVDISKEKDFREER